MLPMLRRTTPAVREEPIDAVWQDLAQIFDRWRWPDVNGDEGALASYPVDVSEENGKIFVEAELPGFKKDEIEVSVDNGILCISAERKEQEDETKRKKHLHERRFTRVQRRFSLPANVDDTTATAKFENGVLRLELPKAENPKEHVIKVS